MQKNFIQKHAILVGIIAFCFLSIPFIREVYGFENAAVNAEVTTTQSEEKNAETQEKDIPKVSKKIVVVDAGHGGYDIGSENRKGAREKDITLQLSEKIGKILEKENIEVVYTRTSDEVVWPSDNVQDLLVRSKIANKSNADYFVSIHANFTDETADIKGSEVWVRHDKGENDRFATNVNEQLKQIAGLSNRGLKDEETAPLSLLRFNKMPSILIETGFLSNPDDLRVLTSEEGQESIARAIAKGVLRTLGEN